MEPPTQNGGAGHILFLNRCAGGLTISGGQNDSVNNSSSIGGGTFPAFPYGDAVWNEVVAETRRIFSRYNITITDVDPSPMPHDEAIVCGGPGALGMPNGVGGVAPFSCGRIPNAITFTFAEVYGPNVEELVATIGQEAAHAWGLEHLLSCNDPMTYLYQPAGDEGSCWPKDFQDQQTQCGEYNPRGCDCGGQTQNSHQHILGMFGSAVPDTQAPAAAITSPTDGETFEVGSNFDIVADVSDDVTLIEVRVFNNGALQATASGAPFGPWPAVNVPEGTYALYIEAEDAAGNVTTSDTITVYVTQDGLTGEPPGESDSDTAEGGSSGGPDDTAGDEDGASNGDSGDAGDAGDAGDDELAGTDGGLPPGFGDDADTGGCACSSGQDVGPGWSVLGIVGLLGLGLRRRR